MPGELEAVLGVAPSLKTSLPNPNYQYCRFSIADVMMRTLVGELGPRPYNQEEYEGLTLQQDIQRTNVTLTLLRLNDLSFNADHKHLQDGVTGQPLGQYVYGLGPNLEAIVGSTDTSRVSGIIHKGPNNNLLTRAIDKLWDDHIRMIKSPVRGLCLPYVWDRFFLENSLYAIGLRNCSRMVKDLVGLHINEQLTKGESAELLSTTPDSNAALLESLRGWSNLGGLDRVHAVMLGRDEESRRVTNSRIDRLGLSGIVELLRTDVNGIHSAFPGRFSAVLNTDPNAQGSGRHLVSEQKDLWSFVKEGGVLLTVHATTNPEEQFIKQIMGIDLYYRHPDELLRLNGESSALAGITSGAEVIPVPGGVFSLLKARRMNTPPPDILQSVVRRTKEEPPVNTFEASSEEDLEAARFMVAAGYALLGGKNHLAVKEVYEELCLEDIRDPNSLVNTFVAKKEGAVIGTVRMVSTVNKGAQSKDAIETFNLFSPPENTSWEDILGCQMHEVGELGRFTMVAESRQNAALKQEVTSSLFHAASDKAAELGIKRLIAIMPQYVKRLTERSGVNIVEINARIDPQGALFLRYAQRYPEYWRPDQPSKRPRLYRFEL